MSDMDRTLADTEQAILKLAAKNGTAAGKAFVKDYGLGLNEKIDRMVLEGLETNVSLVIQRLPWASLVPQTTVEVALSHMHLPEPLVREVIDDLIWTYMATYDQASRKVIRETLQKGNYPNG